MSPPREPDSRTLRRFGRDLAETEPGDGERSAPVSGRRTAERRRDGEHDLTRLNDEELERIPHRERHGRQRPAPSTRRSAREPSSIASAGVAVDPRQATALVLGRVVATTRGPCEIELDVGGVVSAQLPKAMARAYRSHLAVGDRVELAERPSGDWAVARRLPRTSCLSRPDPFAPHRERVLVANLDLAVVVASLRHPPLSTGLLDRFLVALEHGRVGAAIAVNKADLEADDEEASATQALLAPYRELGIPLTFCSAKTGEGLETMRAWIAGRTVALVGHSGVGKSSILNALAPDSGATTGEVAAQRGRGRHTTSQARIYRLPDGARVVDTPGVREFGLWRLTPSELTTYFDDFAPFASRCRFNDCSHVHEPSCAVRQAVESSEISSARFATYLRILESFERE